MATPKRERQKANHAAKVAAQREAARRRRNQRILGAVGAVVVVLAAIWGVTQLVGGDETTDTTTAAGDTATTTAPATPEATAVDYEGYRAQPTACGAEAPGERTEMTFDAAEDLGLSGTLTATIETSCGPLQVELDADTYPQTVNSFAFLAQEGYFDGTACHRIVPGFMAQCGDPTATGTGDPGYSVPDEFPSEGFTYERGVVAMANAGPGSTGSQIFIVTGDASFLPPQYSILGTVVGSEDTLEALDAVPVAPRGNEVSNPLETVYIESVTIAG
jgi:peptidyl-prolyl cis-trans isomerase B (cyclophilin B)